jgi:hypothetical protein
MITQELVNKLFEYIDGKLYWKVGAHRRTDLIGKEVGSVISEDGRKQIIIGQKKYKYHRIVFLMFNGYMPTEVDHDDGNPTNNRIENLRPANRSEQCCNTKLRKDNTTGIKGVYWDKARDKWIVSINKNKETVYRARFDDIELAELVAIEARHKFHKEFARWQ